MINRRKRITYQIIVTLILLMFAAVALTPFVYLIKTSFVSDMSLVFKNGIALKLKPEMLDTHNYNLLVTEDNGLYFSWYKNSVIITVLFTVLSIVLSSMVGYGVSMYEFRGKKIIVALILSTMMIPTETLMIPLYNEVNKLHLLNTYMGRVVLNLVRLKL